MPSEQTANVLVPDSVWKVVDIKAKIAAIDSAPLMAALDEELFSSGITASSPLWSFNNSNLITDASSRKLREILDQFIADNELPSPY